MWNSGMMLRQRSPGLSCSVPAMWRAEAVTLRWESGTSFGREVVPEVCSSSATSSAVAKPPAAGPPAGAPTPSSGCSANRPAGPFVSAASSSTRTPWRRATARAGLSSPAVVTSARGCRSPI
jgi:hypothetical protein